IASWLQSLPKGSLPVAWVTLDKNDNDPLQFWTYVLTSLDNCQEGLCTPLLTRLGHDHPTSCEYVLPELIKIISSLSKELLLVLDDYQAITSPHVHTQLLFLLEHLPPTIHIILISRSAFTLDLTALR